MNTNNSGPVSERLKVFNLCAENLSSRLDDEGISVVLSALNALFAPTPVSVTPPPAELAPKVAETFEMFGSKWNRHTVGSPNPVPKDDPVTVCFRDHCSTGFIAASGWDWTNIADHNKADPIIGWRYKGRGES